MCTISSRRQASTLRTGSALSITYKSVANSVLLCGCVSCAVSIATVCSSERSNMRSIDLGGRKSDTRLPSDASTLTGSRFAVDPVSTKKRTYCPLTKRCKTA